MSITASLYYDAPYQTEADAEVIAIELRGAMAIVQVDQTIFYPEGGGQPSDQGEIIGPTGRVRVELVQFRGGRVLHQGKLMGTLEPGQSVHMQLKWSYRHHNMRVHTAGHLIHDILMGLVPGLIPTKGNHGKKAFLEYEGSVDPMLREDLERLTNAAASRGLPVIMQESSYEDLVARCRFVPPGLPRDKALRVLKIGDFDPMPDGGVHVRDTTELGKVLVQDISVENNRSTIKYRIAGGDSHAEGQ